MSLNEKHESAALNIWCESEVPVEIVHLENVGYYEKVFSDTKVLLLSFSNRKPLSEQPHQDLAKWVRAGGLIVYSGRENNPFQTVSEWWNTSGKQFKCPADDLFAKLGIGQNPKAGTYSMGKGSICVIRKDPREYVLESDRVKVLRETVESLYKKAAGKSIGYKIVFLSNAVRMKLFQ